MSNIQKSGMVFKVNIAYWNAIKLGMDRYFTRSDRL